MDDIKIREVCPEDAARLVILIGQLGYEATVSEVETKIITYRQHTYKLIVAEIDQNVVGYIALHYYDTLHRIKPIGRINSFCVDEKKRGSGVGILLLQEAEKYFLEMKCQKIEVSSNKKRVDTHQFYLKRGYQEYSNIFTKITFDKSNVSFFKS